MNTIPLDTKGMTSFARLLVQTPSESRQEAKIAGVIANEMRLLGYDEVAVDSLFNVVGRVRGEGGGKSLLLSGHIDHAEPGAMAEPYLGKIMDGSKFGRNEPVLYGRGAVDMKGAVAAMVYAGAALQKSGVRLRGDLIAAFNPREEESAGEGVLAMLDQGKITADMAICGEATNLHIYLGHRGNAEVKITVFGRMAHASNPSRGINAAEKACSLAGYIMENYNLPRHDVLGDCTKTILDIKAQTSRKAPVVPDECHLFVDRRFLPGETKDQILSEFHSLIRRAKDQIPDLDAAAEITKWGLPLYTSGDQPAVQALLKARAAVMGGGGPLLAWIFGTDGAFLSERGIPTVGFGPGEERFAHTPEDHVPLSHLETAARVYLKAALEICGS